MTGVKIWNGTAFADPSALKIWNGSAFANISAAHIWDGTKFVKVWPPFSPSLTPISAVGAYTYNLPAGYSQIDVTMLGAGSGGQGGGGSFNNGFGGAAGQWVKVTLVRGVDIDSAATTITGNIGDGGAGSGPSGGSPSAAGPGNPATAIFAKPGGGGTTTLTAAGGSGPAASQVGATPSPTSQTINGQTYSAGTGGATASAAGGPPGGGGAGGNWGAFGSGGAGGKGGAARAWFYAY